MQKRININISEPEALKAMLGLEKYLAKTGISKTLKELIKIRASQINGCAYCLDTHTRDAREYGETNQPILGLSAWQEATEVFTEEEQAALAMTEESALRHRGGLSEETCR